MKLRGLYAITDSQLLADGRLLPYVEAALKGSTAQVTVRLQSELISATRDRDGHVIDGDPAKVSEVVDIWTFARDTGTRDPNWKLVATESAE